MDKKKLTIYMEESTIKELKHKAIELDVSVSILLEKISKEYLNKKALD